MQVRILALKINVPLHYCYFSIHSFRLFTVIHAFYHVSYYFIVLLRLYYIFYNTLTRELFPVIYRPIVFLTTKKSVPNFC